MRGRRSVWVRTGLLETRLPRSSRRHGDWHLDALSVEDLEALMPLSEKLAAADGDPVWTPEEFALMERLWAKATATPVNEAAR